jgi:O-antigen ligase
VTSFLFRRPQWNFVAIATIILLGFSLIFGGASRQHALRLALVELAALPLLVAAGFALFRNGLAPVHRFSVLLLGAAMAVPLLQIVPLPPQIWTSLPGRDQLTLALSLADVAPGWGAISLTPDRTWRSFLALLPPAAMFLAVLITPARAQIRWVHAILGITALSIVFGGIQLASGSERFYPWATTAAGNMVGFFANRNHLATLVLASLPFAAALAGGNLRHPHRGRATLWLSSIFLGLAIIALAAIRSRAGMVLAGPAVVLSLLTAWIATGSRRPPQALLGLFGVVAIAVGAVAVLALPPILNRFDPGATPEGRFENWPVVVAAADTYLPVGSGLGSFDAVYRSVEPLERLDPLFFNQAHNEYLEIWLETGWLGIALVLVFFVWWGRRSLTAWRSPPSESSNIQRAASVSILLILLHSAVDYPLRTVSMAVIFAMCAALLEGAVGTPDPERRRVRRARS